MPAHQRDYQRNDCMRSKALTPQTQRNSRKNDFLNQNREFNTVTVGTIFLAPFLHQYSFIAAESGGLIVKISRLGAPGRLRKF